MPAITKHRSRAPASGTPVEITGLCGSVRSRVPSVTRPENEVVCLAMSDTSRCVTRLQAIVACGLAGQLPSLPKLNWSVIGWFVRPTAMFSRR